MKLKQGLNRVRNSPSGRESLLQPAALVWSTDLQLTFKYLTDTPVIHLV